jgi:uncharacterized protein (UPF0261 family)
MAQVGREVGRRLQHTKGNAIIMIPKAGFDSYSIEGRGFYDPEADAAFVAALKESAPACIRIIERSTHIEDPDFAAEAAQALLSLLAARKRG